MLQCKWKSLILDIAADKAVNIDKKRDITINKELNAVADKVVNTNKKQNIVTKLSILIKDQIIRRAKLGSWI